jgi:hypothetical protein
MLHKLLHLGLLRMLQRQLLLPLLHFWWSELWRLPMCPGSSGMNWVGWHMPFGVVAAAMGVGAGAWLGLVTGDASTASVGTALGLLVGWSTAASP